MYETRAPDEQSWFQRTPAISLELIESTGLPADARIVDIGGGASTLVDELLERGYGRLGVLDVAAAALETVRERLGDRATEVEWFADDVTGWQPPHPWDLWHDRAVFHFQVEPARRDEYLAALNRSVAPDGWALIATFGPDGPDRCSGLPVQRYSAKDLANLLGSTWRLVDDRSDLHVTPAGVRQSFVYALLHRAASS